MAILWKKIIQPGCLMMSDNQFYDPEQQRISFGINHDSQRHVLTDEEISTLLFNNNYVNLKEARNYVGKVLIRWDDRFSDKDEFSYALLKKPNIFRRFFMWCLGWKWEDFKHG